jgi:hypothetical protein
VSRVFEARYPGRCPACTERFDTGDLITYDADDELLHAVCATTTPREPAVRPMCPVCFTELPLTGVCGNCT